MNRRYHHSRPAALRSGFTLIEAALALVIVGVGILSTVQLFASCSIENRVATGMTSAMLLAQNVREAMTGLSFSDPYASGTAFGAEPGETLAGFDDVDDFDGQTINPPIDSLRAPIASQGQYTQVVTVVPVFTNKLNSNLNDAALEIPKGTYTGAVRVRVRILYQARTTDPPAEVYRTAWIRLDD